MFDHVISLGWFCSPAHEIRRIGLRDASYPFDWLITHNFSIIINLIKNNRYLKLYADEMLQYDLDESRWYNREYMISIFYDFNKYKKMCSQIDSVNEKYFRRMKRFYENIAEPTLFLRYVKDENEALFISRNESRIESIFKDKNEGNEIVYIANFDLKDILHLSNSPVYFVKPDNQDCVARSFLKQLPDLLEYMGNNVRKPKAQVGATKSSNNKGFFSEVTKILLKCRNPAKNKCEIHKEGFLERKQENQIILFRDLEDCCGCGACAAICPKKAIEMVLDQDFYYPIIDRSLCIQCKKCLKICPFK